MSYLGSKAASGAYQAIIANMPEHDIYIEAFLGTGTIFNRKPPVIKSIGLELDKMALDNFCPEHDIELYQIDAFQYLSKLIPEPDRTTFVYLDPPYLPETRTSSKRYQHELTHTQHIELLSIVQELTKRGIKVMLSGYPSMLYDKLLNDWRTYEFRVMTRGGVRTEKLWMNYDAETTHWAAFAGQNYTDRQRIKRKAKRWATKYKKLPPQERIAIMAAMIDI